MLNWVRFPTISLACGKALLNWAYLVSNPTGVSFHPCLDSFLLFPALHTSCTGIELSQPCCTICILWSSRQRQANIAWVVVCFLGFWVGGTYLVFCMWLGSGLSIHLCCLLKNTNYEEYCLRTVLHARRMTMEKALMKTTDKDYSLSTELHVWQLRRKKNEIWSLLKPLKQTKASVDTQTTNLRGKLQIKAPAALSWEDIRRDRRSIQRIEARVYGIYLKGSHRDHSAPFCCTWCRQRWVQVEAHFRQCKSEETHSHKDQLDGKTSGGCRRPGNRLDFVFLEVFGWFRQP